METALDDVKGAHMECDKSRVVVAMIMETSGLAQGIDVVDRYALQCVFKSSQVKCRMEVWRDRAGCRLAR